MQLVWIILFKLLLIRLNGRYLKILLKKHYKVILKPRALNLTTTKSV